MRSVGLGVLSGALCVALATGSAPAARSVDRAPEPSRALGAGDRVLFEVTTDRGTSFTARGTADGSTFRRVTHPNFRHTGSTLSPDRRLLLIQESPVVIDVASPTGAGRHNLLTSTENQFSYQAIWSPDSASLLVTADRGSRPELLVVPVDGGEPVHLAYDYETSAYGVQPYGWSPGGGAAVFRGLRDVDGVEQPVFVRIRRDGSRMRELTGWHAYAARPGGLTGAAVVATASGTGVVKVGAGLAVRRTLLPLGSAESEPELVWSADGRRLAVLHGDPGHQRIVVLSASGRVVQRITPSQPRGVEGVVGVMRLSSGGSLVSWSYANYVGAPFTDAEGLFFRDLARRRTCRKAPAGRHLWWSTVTYAPDDSYAVVERDDNGVSGLLRLDRPGRIEPVSWVPDGATATGVQFVRTTTTTIAPRPCRG